MSAIALVHATFADTEEAERIARTVIAERLAACANILAPCTSIYRWQGAVEQAREVPALFKTQIPLAAALVARIAALHGYDQPVIESWTAQANAGTHDWIMAETGAPSP